MSDELSIKRWSAKRKSALVIDVFKGKTTPVERADTPRKLPGPVAIHLTAATGLHARHPSALVDDRNEPDRRGYLN